MRNVHCLTMVHKHKNVHLIFYYRKKGTCTDKQELNERLITNTEETVKKVMKYFIQQI